MDDGTGALTVEFGLIPTEKILGLTLAECMDRSREEMRTDWVKEEIVDNIVARPMEITGNVEQTDYGLVLRADAGAVLDLDPKAEAQKLLAEMQAE